MEVGVDAFARAFVRHISQYGLAADFGQVEFAHCIRATGCKIAQRAVSAPATNGSGADCSQRRGARLKEEGGWPRGALDDG